MSDSRSFYRTDGDGFDATEWTRGPWNPEHQHGGPPSALIARAIERIPFDVGPSMVARLTVEFLRPILITKVFIETEVLRQGRKAQVVGARLRSADALIARATAVRIRTVLLDLPTRVSHSDAPLSPEKSPSFELSPFGPQAGYLTAMEGRLARGTMGSGSITAWMRARIPLVDTESWSPLQRVMVAADSGNGVSMVLDPFKFTFINPDLTVHLHRLPEGEWICLEATTTPENHGVGLADCALWDEHGRIGRSAQSLVIDAR